MSTREEPELVREVRDALAHLYDYAYLERHALAARLAVQQAGSSHTRAQETRRILLDAIELLNPGDNVALRALERRAYAILFGLYVEGRAVQELAASLGIGGRQLRRDRAAALEALARILLDRFLPDGTTSQDGSRGLPGADTLRVESRRLAQQWEQVDLDVFIQKLLSVLAELAREQQVVLESHLRGPLPKLQLNYTLMRQILLSLASQAITNLPLARLAFDIRLTETVAGIGLRMVYAAHGVAPPKNLAALIPDHAAIDTMVAALGGELYMEAPQPDRQAIWVLLPSEHKLTVLLVDDKLDLFELFKRYLANHPYRLIHAAGVDPALELVKTERPELILLDLMMPDRDGWEFLQALRSEPQMDRIPVIVCSVLHEPELAFSLGAQAVLRKPVGSADLLQALAAAKKQLWAGEVRRGELTAVQ